MEQKRGCEGVCMQRALKRGPKMARIFVTFSSQVSGQLRCAFNGEQQKGSIIDGGIN